VPSAKPREPRLGFDIEDNPVSWVKIKPKKDVGPVVTKGKSTMEHHDECSFLRGSPSKRVE
jgi:hypothetical protein